MSDDDTNEQTPDKTSSDEPESDAASGHDATRVNNAGTPSTPSTADDFTTTRVLGNRYEVGELIGRGGMAEVHEGHDLRLGRAVAIKILRNELARDTSFLARFRREAQAAAGLNHPAIVAVYDSGEQEIRESGGAPLQVPYIVMERVEGRTLRDVLNEERVLDPEEAARITASVLAGLDYAHTKGIVHRDIKPANVMLTRGGAVKVMDFGIARALADTAATMTQTQAVLGTARYLSPEQAQGNPVDARSDLYSTGCLLFELLSGRTPFQGDPVSLVYQHLGEPPKPPSTFQTDLPQPYDAIALHALAKTPETRYQSALEFREDLNAARSGSPISDAANATYAHAARQAANQAPVGPGGMPPAGWGGAAAAAGAGFTDPSTGAATQAVPTQSGGARFDDEYEQTGELPVAEERHTGGYWVLGTLGLLALAAVAFVVFQVMSPPEVDETVQVSVPAVVSMTQERAETVLEDANLKPEIELRKSSDAKGEVIEQDPLPNTQVDENSAVQVVVSSGPDAIQIPDVEGFTEEAARDLLGNDDILVAADTEEENDVDFAKGRVISTTPGAGDSVAPDEEVVLTVASGQTEVPNVIGENQGDAILTLREFNLAPATRYRESSESSPNTVLEQSIKAGEEVDYDTQITLTIASSPVPTITQTTTVTATQTTPATEETEPPAEPTDDPAEPTDDPPTETDPPAPTDAETNSEPDP